MAVKTWIWVVVGSIFVMGIALIVVAGTGLYWVARNVDIEPATGASAAQQFEHALARFEGQRPLVEIVGDDWILLPERGAGREDTAREIDAIQVLVWEPHENKLARIRVPFWLLRLAGTGSIRLSSRNSELDFENLKITVEDIERFGPGLILDHTEPDEGRVLVWAE